MELWIIAQDRETLIKVDRLDYDISEYKHRIVANGFQTLVAEYKTKKRALEVLNDISSKIKNQFIVEVAGLWKLEDVMKMRDTLKSNYEGEFIMETKPLKIKPINQNLIYYEMPQE